MTATATKLSAGPTGATKITDMDPAARLGQEHADVWRRHNEADRAFLATRTKEAEASAHAIMREAADRAEEITHALAQLKATTLHGALAQAMVLLPTLELLGTDTEEKERRYLAAVAERCAYSIRAALGKATGIDPNGWGPSSPDPFNNPLPPSPYLSGGEDDEPEPPPSGGGSPLATLGAAWLDTRERIIALGERARTITDDREVKRLEDEEIIPLDQELYRIEREIGALPAASFADLRLHAMIVLDKLEHPFGWDRRRLEEVPADWQADHWSPEERCAYTLARGVLRIVPQARSTLETLEQEACRLWDENAALLSRDTDEDDRRASAVVHEAREIDEKILAAPCNSLADAAVKLRRMLDGEIGIDRYDVGGEEVDALIGILAMLERVVGKPAYPTRPIYEAPAPQGGEGA